ncbi:MAG: 1-phosphofructokinase [Oscillospiraceae bacterium]|nr:1-phosphofructokinase [Oscillospiraceae bacterium]
MFYTVTFNPAIDYVVHTDGMQLGSVNRSGHEEIYFGGKGINVSIVLKELGISSKALGFTAGFTGRAIEEGVQKKGVETDFVHLEKGFSRINVKIKSAEETELNGQGPDISEKEVSMLFEKLENLTDGDTLVLAGSIPNTLPSDIYEKILEMLSGKNIRVVVDATKDLLMNVLKYKPFLIKPNNHELGEMFGVTLTSEDEIISYAEKLREMGAMNVLVSMAGDGAILVDEYGKVHKCGTCKGKVKNSVGAGDSMLAGFIAGLEEGGYEYALKLGTASGGATAFSEGLAQKEDVYKLLEQLK